MAYNIEIHEAFDCARKSQDVFEYIADFSRIDEWDHTIVSAHKVSIGQVALGTKFDLVFSMGLRKVPIQYEVVEYKPSTRLVLIGSSANFTATDTVDIKRIKGGCHVSWNAELAFKGRAEKIVPLMEKKIVSGARQTIKDLAIALADNYPAPELGFLPKLGDKLIVPGVLGFTKFGYRQAKKSWRPVTANNRGKHAVITGATSGLGLATAKQLAHLGMRLTLVARDKKKAESVKNDLIEQTGNSNIEIEAAELSHINEVQSLIARLQSKGDAIDVLINNAGALLNPRQMTGEGIEKSFALLLLSPYVLSEGLHSLLAKSTAARVINVSSGGMYAKRISLSNLESDKGEYGGSDAYARAKRGLVIMGEQWAEKWADDNITVHNMHPGWAFTPGVEVGLPEFTQRTRKVLRTAEEGADTIIWLATATEAAKTSGLFWLDRLPHSTHLTAKTKETKEQRAALKRALEEYAGRFKAEA